MTAKAKSLVGRMERSKDMSYQYAKQCALIAVDETLCILSDLCCDFGGNDVIEKEIAYWTEVKHELKKSE
jgi:hypothetical protein